MQAIFGLLMRHGLTLLAGALAAKGVISPGETGQFIELGASLATGAVGVIWSVIQKKKSGALSPQ